MLTGVSLGMPVGGAYRGVTTLVGDGVTPPGSPGARGTPAVVGVVGAKGPAVGPGEGFGIGPGPVVGPGVCGPGPGKDGPGGLNVGVMRRPPPPTIVSRPGSS